MNKVLINGINKDKYKINKKKENEGVIERFKSNKGFTLIELIVVVGIIGILVGIASPRFSGFTKDAHVATMKADTKVLEDAAMIYHLDNDDSWPTNGTTKENLDSELERVLNGAKVQGIKDSIENKNIQSLKRDLDEYGIITSSGKHEGTVVHLQGVKGKDEITYYNSRLNSGSDKIEESAPSKDSALHPNAPGSKTQLGETTPAGVKFFGEVPSSELFTGTEISTATGITQGTLINNNAGWLKFEIKDNDNKVKTLFVAKNNVRHSISWDHINSNGAVAGTKTVTKDDVTYKVRLMEGLHKGANGYNGSSNHGSEWNRLMLPIHEESIDNSWAHPNNVGENEKDASIAHTLGTGKKLYTNNDLHTNSTSGSYSWMQDKGGGHPIIRGYSGVSYSIYSYSDDTNNYVGWRPVLEVSSNPQE